jgi:hypothetical protein
MVAVEAVIESALLSWVGLLLHAVITTINMVDGDYQYDEDDLAWASYTMLPYLFGISQCLITVRLAFARQTGPITGKLRLSPSLLDRNGQPIFVPSSQFQSTYREHEMSALATLTPFVLDQASVQEYTLLKDNTRDA